MKGNGNGDGNDRELWERAGIGTGGARSSLADLEQQVTGRRLTGPRGLLFGKRDHLLPRASSITCFVRRGDLISGLSSRDKI